MKVLLLLLLLTYGNAYSQNVLPITPAPAHAVLTGDVFLLDNNTITTFSDHSSRSFRFLAQYLEKHYRITLKVKSSKSNKTDSTKQILFRYIKNAPADHYKLSINSRKIVLEGSEQGMFYAVQTLIQLMPVEGNSSNNFISIPGINIIDSARFNYRGMHLDVGRHAFSVAYIKRYIDFLALHKINNFHWHLTEDQGWRIEIKKYPELTLKGSCRNQTLEGAYGSNRYDGKKYCAFYSQEEIKDIVAYAADRYINIIPEIDMPGHTNAALSAYPFLGCSGGPYKVMETWGVSENVLCAGKDSTYVFIENVLKEVMQLFPGRYIHIGGDECPKTSWQSCKTCQLKIKQEQLKDEHELQSYYIRRIEKFLNKHGRTIIGWDEILEGGLAPNAVVMSWRGENGAIAAARQKHYAILSPESPFYLNHSQSRNEDSVTQGGYNPLESVYNYDPVPKALNEQEKTFILGAQGNMWSEYLDNEKKLEYMLFPRISALSEVLWTTPSQKSWTGFEARLPVILKRYQLWNVNFSTAYYDVQPAVIPSSSTGISWKLETKHKAGKIIYTNDRTARNIFPYTSPVVINESGIFGAACTDDNNNLISSWIWQQFRINNASGKKISLAQTPDKAYSFGGAFSLVDGIQNEKGMSKSIQFLGFRGDDLDATIDLGTVESVNTIILHCFEQPESWIYAPSSVEIWLGLDENNFFKKEIYSLQKKGGHLTYTFNHPARARYIRIKAANSGLIPPEKPGAGNKAWLFSDEIEVF